MSKEELQKVIENYIETIDLQDIVESVLRDNVQKSMDAMGAKLDYKIQEAIIQSDIHITDRIAFNHYIDKKIETDYLTRVSIDKVIEKSLERADGMKILERCITAFLRKSWWMNSHAIAEKLKDFEVFLDEKIKKEIEKNYVITNYDIAILMRDKLDEYIESQKEGIEYDSE